MNTTWTGAALAGLLAAGLGGCAHGQRSAQAAAADESRRAAQQATRTERELADASRRLDGARQEAARAQQRRDAAQQQLSQAEQRMAQAQQRLAQEQANVQRLDATARQQRTRAADASARAQAAAEEAQGLRSVEGRIAQASSSQVVLQAQGGQTMAFQLDPRTRVLVGAEQRSLADLQQGADARVAYDPRAPQPTAVTIHVAPARRPGTAPALPQPAR